MKELVLVHGRAQENKDGVELKKEWLDSWKKGLQKSGLAVPIPEDRVRFPYYGDTLHGLVSGVAEGEVAEVVVRGTGAPDPEEREFILAVLDQVRERRGVSDAQVLAEAQAAVAQRGGAAEVVERGPLNWGWVQGILSAIDRHVPGASGASIALATRDVYRYLRDPGIRDVIDSGVRKAMSPNVESVVVGHSLGSVVSYSLLKREGEAMGWKVPLYVTVGSPLGVQRIRKGFAPNKHPECVGKWFNAMDPRDVVALFALDEANFPIDPTVENKIDVDNGTPNRHGISGYLSDAVVARRIHDALVAS